VKKGIWKKVAILVAVVVAGYFIQVEVNTYLGKKVLANMDLKVHTLDEAFAAARADSKLVLADLSAIWCPGCRTLDKQVLSAPAVQKEINKNFVFARIEYETEEGQAFKKRYKVSGFPNLLILDDQGKLVRKLPTVFDPDTFIANLKQ
jgi:thiol:disulfide interchange protein